MEKKSQNNAIKKIQDRLLESLIVFHSLCEKYNLKYCLIGGTLLGAIRHEGFIPWDDDVDVGMPRSDYEKLLSLKPFLSKNIILKSIKYDDNYIYPYAKIINEEIIVIEKFIKPYKSGVWIDIFPFDSLHSNFLLSRIQFFLIRITKTIISIKVKSYRKKSFLIDLLKFVLGIFLKPISVKFLYSLAKLISTNANGIKKREYLVNFFGAYGKKDIAKNNIFDNRRLVNFEGCSLWIPENYHDYLSFIYGDYMTPPPLSNRGAGHVDIDSIILNR